MTIAYVNSVSASSANNSTVTTGSIDTTGGDFLVMVVANTHDTVMTRSDSKGNTYTSLTQYDNAGGGGSIRILYSANPTVGSGHTFTNNYSSGNPAYPSVIGAAYSGVKLTSPSDGVVGNANTGSTSISAGSITPSENNCLMIAAFYSNNTNTPTVPSSTTQRQSRALVAALAYGVTLADEVQTTATARNYSWSWASSNNDAAVTTAVFKSEPAAGATRGTPFGNNGTAFNGGRCMQGIIR